MINELMKFDPATGEEKPYPSHSEQWRIYHGATAWLFNPYTGKRRKPEDVGTDCFGYAISTLDEGENMKAAPEKPELMYLAIDTNDSIPTAHCGILVSINALEDAMNLIDENTFELGLEDEIFWSLKKLIEENQPKEK